MVLAHALYLLSTALASSGHALRAACVASDWARAATVAAELAADAHALYESDRFADAIDAYGLLLHRDCGCNGTEPCASLKRRAQLQVHANLGSSLMHAAREPAAAPSTRAARLELSAFHWSVPRTVAPDEPTLAYFYRLNAADAQLARALVDARAAVDDGAGAARHEMVVEPVERRDGARLSRAEFLARYAFARIPVVLTAADAAAGGLVPNLLDELVRACGAREVRLRRHGGGEGWAGLETSAGATRLDAYATALAGGAGGWQLFDWPLPRECAEGAALARDWLPAQLRPSAAEDVLAGLPPSAGCALGDGWPSLFLQPARTRCGAHVDAYGTHFFQLLLNGTKRWRIAAPAETHLLAPRPPRLRALGVTSLFEPLDYARQPQLRLLRVREVELRAGELLFVPAGSAHQVLNGDTPVAALSANFIDGSNAREAASELYFGAELGTRVDVACTLEHVERRADAAEATSRAVAAGAVDGSCADAEPSVPSPLFRPQSSNQ
jgi:hypothetical protein